MNAVNLKSVSWGRWIPILTLAFLFGYFAWSEPAFLTDRNLTNLTRQVAVNCILACGMTLIILLGAIDLSIGSVLALGAVIGATLQQNLGYFQGGMGEAILSAIPVLLICASLSSFTGFMVARFKIPSFVVTLGLLVIARGLALIISGGSRIGPLSDSYRWLGTGFLPPTPSLLLIVVVTAAFIAYALFRRRPQTISKIILALLAASASFWIFCGYQGIPVPVLATGAVFLAIYFILEKTILGRHIYAIGGNPEAARLCGIRVPRVIFAVYFLMGILVALASLIESGRIDAGDPNAGNLYELDAIAAVVIGGTSLQGGVGRVTGTILGSLLIGTLNNGMSLLNIETNRQMVIKGLIIIAAVWMDVVSKRSRAS